MNISSAAIPPGLLDATRAGPDLNLPGGGLEGNTNTLYITICAAFISVFHVLDAVL